MQKLSGKMMLFALALTLLGSGWLEGRQAGREIARQVVDLQRQSQTARTEWLQALKQKLHLQAAAFDDGASYIAIIPYVTSENGSRSNLGLNNYSQISFVHGILPTATVSVFLYDQQGNLRRSDSYTVGSNELLQINDVVNQLATIVDPVLGGNVGTGWLLIASDEPLTAWASVIANANEDPSIELAIADQINKPAAFVESTGSLLAIQSSAKTAKFQSSLAVVNVGSGDGNLFVDIYDQTGHLITTKQSTIKENGMFIDNDIRAVAPGTFGQIVIEVTDPDPSDNKVPRLVANSIVRSTDNGTGGFFPAFALPNRNTKSLAGIWQGSLEGTTLINAQVTIQLYQERDMLYGTMDILSGTFPTVSRNFSISGSVVVSGEDNYYFLQIEDAFDTDDAKTFFAYRMFAPPITGTTMKGDSIYYDEKDRRESGSFSLVRTGPIYPIYQ
jgi:hypothetical protein